MMDLKKVEVAGIPLAATNPVEAAEWICSAALKMSAGRHGLAVHLVNAYTISLIHKDPVYAATFESTNVNFADGTPLARICRLKDGQSRQIRGPRLFGDVANIGRNSKLAHFLLGGDTATLQSLETQLISRYPGVRIVGTYSPPFRTMTPDEIDVQDEIIAESGAQVVWVGLGTPKQDYEVERLAFNLPVVAIAIGAAFDFIAGTKKEAPRWLSSIGLEWLFRLCAEPRRLWKRYLVGNLVFLWAVLRPRKA